jgi:hypothetical protein
MPKSKMTVRSISEKEAFEGLSPKRIAAMKQSLANIKFASKNKIEVFSGTYSSVPIPVHLLGKKLSKNDERIIAGLVALIVNDVHGKFARTIQYIHKMPKDNPQVQMIVKNSKYAEKRGKEHKKLLDELWAKKDKLKKGELFRLWLGI